MSSVFLNAQTQQVRSQQVRERNQSKNKGLFEKLHLDTTALERSAELEQVQSVSPQNTNPIEAQTHKFRSKSNAKEQAFAKDIQQSVVLIQAVNTAIDEGKQLLDQMRGIVEQALNDQLPEVERKRLQLELNRLNQSLYRVSHKTKFQGKSIFQHEQSKLKLVTQSNGEIEEISFQSIRPDVLAKQARLHSSHGTASELSLLGVYSDKTPNELRGTLKINGVQIRDSMESDDRYSTQDPAGSAVAKANTINEYKDKTGVEAFVSMTRTDLCDLRNDAFALPLFGNISPIQAYQMQKNEAIYLNQSKIEGLKIQAKDFDQSLRNAINALSEQTGVNADLTEDGSLLLLSNDGRNIHLKYEGNQQGRDLENAIGLRDGNGGSLCYTAQIILFSKKSIELQIKGPLVNESLGDILGVFMGESLIHQGEFIFGINREYSLSQIDIKQLDHAAWALTTLDIAMNEVKGIDTQIKNLYAQLIHISQEQMNQHYDQQNKQINPNFLNILKAKQEQLNQGSQGKRLLLPAPPTEIPLDQPYSPALIALVKSIQLEIYKHKSLSLMAQANFSEQVAWRLLEGKMATQPLQIQYQLYPSLFYNPIQDH